MKTTIDLPEDLVRQMKMRAASEGRRLRDVATEIFSKGLIETGGKVLKIEQTEIKLPLFETDAELEAPASQMNVRDLLDLEQQIQREEDLRRVGGTL